MTEPTEVDPIELMRAREPVFLVGETMTRNVMASAHGDEPAWRVVIGMAGKWNHGAEDHTLLMFAPDNAVAVATSLVAAALACSRDASVLAEVERLLEVFDP